MKTIATDLGAFLKRNGHSMTLCYDGKVFIVKHGDISARSQFLDDALENIAEETRRRANNMQPVRETKLEPKPAPTVTLPAGTVAVNPAPTPSRLPSISQAAQQAYQQQAAAHCQSCKGAGKWYSHMLGCDLVCIPCGGTGIKP